jgi:hypothetical protein
MFFPRSVSYLFISCVSDLPSFLVEIIFGVPTAMNRAGSSCKQCLTNNKLHLARRQHALSRLLKSLHAFIYTLPLRGYSRGHISNSRRDIVNIHLRILLIWKTRQRHGDLSSHYPRHSTRQPTRSNQAVCSSSLRSINQRYVPIHRLDNLELVPGERQRCFAHFGAVKSFIFWVSEKCFIKWGCGLVV